MTNLTNRNEIVTCAVCDAKVNRDDVIWFVDQPGADSEPVCQNCDDSGRELLKTFCDDLEEPMPRRGAK
jgi:hypothetical protein